MILIPTAKRTPPRVRNKSRRTSENQREPFRYAEICSIDLFLVLVPQGLELLLALVFGDFLTPFFLKIAHDDTTFVLFN